MSKRINIGTMNRAGLPISAPVESFDEWAQKVHRGVRWVRKGESFVLEVMTMKSTWDEVPFVEVP